MRGLIWFREDLRINDNQALYYATQKCTDGVIGVYIIDQQFWKKHDVAPCRIAFILRGLQRLQQDLQKLNISLLCFEVVDSSKIAAQLLSMTAEYKLGALFFNRQYEVNEDRRDQAIVKKLAEKGIVSYSYDDQVILAPGTIKTKKNSYFKLFTPFKHTWLEIFNSQSGITLLPKIKPQAAIAITETNIPVAVLGHTRDLKMELWQAGEQAAIKRLQQFITTSLFDYAVQRDFPALAGTSQLSPYLTAGMISPRQCFLAALNKNQQSLNSGNSGALVWMSELIWREFYKHLLFAFPRLSMNRPFLLKTEVLPWNNDKKILQAWQLGNTGFPIIDAAMRQLNTIGWMHNRLRMIVAMFLARNLMLDWRLGERYFMQNLIDGDLAANNGGWQWCAATGADVAPYFRVFNPVRQSERFDPEGLFIRQYCPELAMLNNNVIHDPWQRAPELAKQCGYPISIVDLDCSKKHFITMFKQI